MSRWTQLCVNDPTIVLRGATEERDEIIIIIMLRVMGFNLAFPNVLCGFDLIWIDDRIYVIDENTIVSIHMEGKKNRSKSLRVHDIYV